MVVRVAQKLPGPLPSQHQYERDVKQDGGGTGNFWVGCATDEESH